MPNHPGTGFGTRGHPPLLSGGGGGGDLKWQEAVSVDWTGVSHNFETTAAKTIDGVEWKCLNNGADLQTGGLISGDSGTGLRIWPDGAEHIWANRVDLPMVTVLVKDAIGTKTTYAMNKHAVCFQCTYTAAQDIRNQWDHIGAIAMNSAVGTSATDPRYLTAGAYSSSGATDQWRTIRQQTAEGHHNHYDASTDTAVTDRDLLQIIIWPGQDYIGTIVGSVGTMPGDGFPDPNDWAPPFTRSMDFRKNTDGTKFTLLNLRVGMFCCAQAGITPDPNPVFSSCRVMYMEMV